MLRAVWAEDFNKLDHHCSPLTPFPKPYFSIPSQFPFFKKITLRYNLVPNLFPFTAYIIAPVRGQSHRFLIFSV